MPLLLLTTDIQAGQGLYFETISQTWRAKDCTTDSYGVSNTTYGLTASPCKPCPTGTIAANTAAFNNSAQHFMRNADGSGGFNSESACVMRPGEFNSPGG